MRPGSKDSFKIYINGKDQFNFVYSTPITHTLVKSTDNVTIQFEADKASFGIYEAPMASVGVVAPGELGLRKNFVVLNGSRLTSSSSDDRTQC